MALVVGVAVLGALPVVVEGVSHAVGGALLMISCARQIGHGLTQAGSVDVGERPDTVFGRVHKLEGARAASVLRASGGHLSRYPVSRTRNLAVCSANARCQRVVP